MEKNAYASEQVRAALPAYLMAQTGHTWTLMDKGWLMDDAIESYSQASELAEDWSRKIGTCSVVMPGLGTFVYRILNSAMFTLPQSEAAPTLFPLVGEAYSVADAERLTGLYRLLREATNAGIFLGEKSFASAESQQVSYQLHRLLTVLARHGIQPINEETAY